MSGSVFAERIEKVKETKFELELIKIVDCFLMVMVIMIVLKLFLKNLYNKQNFLFQLARVMSVPTENKMLLKNEIPKQKN